MKITVMYTLVYSSFIDLIPFFICIFHILKHGTCQIASHPNLYVLDSPGILRLKIAHNDMGAKLALTGLELPKLLCRSLFFARLKHSFSFSTAGALEDFLIGEYDLARYFLAILNLSEEYKRWEKLKDTLDDTLSSVSLEKHVVGRDTVQRKLRQYPSDHTQVSSSKIYSYMMS